LPETAKTRANGLSASAGYRTHLLPLWLPHKQAKQRDSANSPAVT